jgi:signal transduction histidine kinase
MRIWQKLTVGLTVIIALMAINGWGAVRIMDETEKSVETMMDDDYSAVLASEHMITALFDMNLQESYYLAFGEPVYLENYNRSRADYMGWNSTAGAVVLTAEERALLHNLSASFTAYDGLHLQVVGLYDAGDASGANNLSLGASNDEFYRTYDSLLGLEALNTESLDATYAEVEDSMREGTLLQRFLSSVLLVIAVVFGAIVSGSIASSVGALTRGAERLGDGELGHQVEVQTGDELGELSSSFNSMSLRLKDRESELRRVNAQLTDANERLKRLDAMKSLLLGNVSHELRTPLASIKGHVELVLDEQVGPVNERQREALDFADRDADHLNRLIEELLVVSSIEFGSLRLQRARVDLREAIDWCVERMGKELRQKAIGVEVRTPPGLPELHADRDRLVQVLSNILRNAINFSPQDSRITVEARRSGGVVEARVSDQGIGVPPDSLERIFDRFYQVDSSTTRRVGGVGLGLYICKGIVEAHGGRIWAESEGGKGTTIVFQLPVGEEG